ncbi:hypothetical protein BC936DRAFT_138315 [Jimgerdemannia flammicorona]|uniref:Methyltransferase type 11 domain-containing protein n=1 Tax=Jimgerdemannia flammicorona TaxID=994334 RepID=A0A433DIJ4_9FUNG|nr:hypothetical protein BC936DRAFT_138315 [Jimgerdemannia flammicorona]
MALPSTSNQQPTSTNEEPSRMSDYLRSNLKWFTNRAAPMQNTPEGNFFLKNDEEEVDRTLVHHGAMKMAFGSTHDRPSASRCACPRRRDVATEYPLSQFTGIDIDSYVLPTSTMPQNTEFECVDVFSMPYAEGTFDFVYVGIFAGHELK